MRIIGIVAAVAFIYPSEAWLSRTYFREVSLSQAVEQAENVFVVTELSTADAKFRFEGDELTLPLRRYRLKQVLKSSLATYGNSTDAQLRPVVAPTETEMKPSFEVGTEIRVTSGQELDQRHQAKRYEKTGVARSIEYPVLEEKAKPNARAKEKILVLSTFYRDRGAYQANLGLGEIAIKHLAAVKRAVGPDAVQTPDPRKEKPRPRE